MTFPAYLEYKDSGVEWLGSVPIHWGLYSLKRSVEGCVNGIWGDEPDGDNDLAVIRVADFLRSRLRVGTKKLTYRSITVRERESRSLWAGDLLIEKSGGGDKTLVGCVVLFDHEFGAVSSNFVARMRPVGGFDGRFLCYAFDSLYKGKVNYPSIKQTTGIQNLDSDAYLSERFCFPPLKEQTQIARFLDHETARIDALIEEQRRLIELLKEKRQAVISHAVTKGLDPTVPMKDSGVEWLGEVPEHWRRSCIKRVSTIKYGIGEPPKYQESGVPLIRATNVDHGSITSHGMVFVEPNDIPQKRIIWLKAGDIIVVRSGAYTGDSAIVLGNHLPAIAGFDMVLQNITCNPRFLQYVLLSSFMKDSQIDLEKMRAAQPHLNAEELGECVFLMPPISEQDEIVDMLERKTNKFDKLVAEAEATGNLLKERRSALISAAVTGKIDVRDWQPDQSASANTEHDYAMVAEFSADYR